MKSKKIALSGSFEQKNALRLRIMAIKSLHCNNLEYVL